MIVSIQKKKEDLRNYYLRIRSHMSEEEYKKCSRVIIRRLKDSSAYNQAKWVHCYVSINERREVNTHPLIQEMLSGKKQAVVPVTNFGPGTLTHVQLNNFEDLNSNKWGVPEPGSGDEVTADDLDLVVVPMVAGDPQCNRLGYGKGFYDRFLSQVDCPKIGLLYESCMAEQLPTEDFDVTLDQIITEDRVVRRE